MPLPYNVNDALDIPAEAFNADGIAVIEIRGGRYGGDWVISASAGRADGTIGEIETCYDLSRDDLTKDERYPDLAVDTAYVWLHGEMKQRGWRLLAWENFNAHCGPDERPYFMAARAVVGSDKFVPAAGVKYADEIPV